MSAHLVKFPITSNRFIAYLDLMGFTDLVFRYDHEEVHEKMNLLTNVAKIINDQQVKRKADDQVRFVLFSDSILLISAGARIKDASNILSVSQLFLNIILSEGIPMKGALAYGKFTADFNKACFFGRPLIDAHNLMDEVHFYGVVLHHTFEEELLKPDPLRVPVSKSEVRLYKELSRKENKFLKRAKLPMKSGDITHSYLKWHVELFDKFYDELFMRKKFYALIKNDKSYKRTKEEVLDIFYTSASGSVRKYVDNTSKVYLGLAGK